MGLSENTSNFEVNHYPTFVEKEMNIDFPNIVSGEAKIAIYSISGNKVFSHIDTVSPLQKTTLNLSELASGLYLATIQINQFSTSWKFIKK
jgi:pectate lyase